MLVVVWISIWL